VHNGLRQFQVEKWSDTTLRLRFPLHAAERGRRLKVLAIRPSHQPQVLGRERLPRWWKDGFVRGRFSWPSTMPEMLQNSGVKIASFFPGAPSTNPQFQTVV